MTGTKILVLHIRQIIKAALFITGIVLLLFILMFFFLGRDSATQSVFNPGTYTAQITLNYKPAQIEVTVTEDEITNIVLNPLSENQEIFYPLLMSTTEAIAGEIIENQSLSIVSSYENITTSKVVINAISRALEMAMAEDIY